MDKKRLYESVLEQFLSGDSVSARGEELWRGKSAAASKKLGEYKDYKASGGSGLSDLATSQLGSKDFYTPSTLREFDAEKTFRSYLDQQGFVRKFRNEGVWDVEGNAPSAWSDSFLTDQLKALQGRIADSKVKDEEHNARQKQRAAQAAELRKLSDDYYHGLSYEELLDAFAGDEEQISSVVNDWLSLNGITSPSENAPSTWDELRSIEDEEEYQDWLNKLHSGWVNAEWNTLGLPEEYTSETAGLQNQYDNALKEQESRNSWNIYKNLAEQTSGTLDLEKYYRENIDGYGQQDVQIEGYDSEVFSEDRMLNLVYFINHANGSGYQFNTLSALQGTGLFSNKELDTVWGYYEKGYNFLLPEEIVVYNDLYATDPKIAQGFLDSLQEDLLKRRYMVKNAETDVLATSKELAVPAFMASVWGNAIDAVSALPKAVQTLQGNDSYFSPLNDPANLARGIRSAQGEGLGEYEWANKLGTVGGNNVLQQFYYGGASAVDNAFRLGAGGGNPAVALALAGMGSTSSALQDLSLRDDMSPAAKVTQAALTGALEVATEKIGLDNLFKMDVTSAGKYLLNSMGAELGEEVINALGQEGLDYVVAQFFGHEAEIKSAGERGTDLINTVIQTAISAALMGSGGAASIAISNQNAGNTLKNQGDLDAVVSIAENLGENTESAGIAKTIREMQKGGKGVSNYNIGRLVRAVANDIGEENAQVVNRVAEEAIENRLVELGQSPEAAKKNAPAIRKVSQGGKLNLKERAAVAWDDRATQVLKEMTAAPSAEEAEGPEQVNWRQEMETATQEAKATADGRQKQLADALTNKSSTTGRVAKAAQKADSLASGKNKSLAPTEVIFKQEGESVKGTFTRFEKGKDGSLRLVVTAGNTEKTVSIDEVTSAGDKGMATIYHYVQDPRHEMSAQEASTMVNTYAQVGGDAGAFVLDFENAYLSGYSGMESPGAQKGNKVYAIAYDQGKQEAAADEKTRVEKARQARRVETPSVGWLGEVVADADVKGSGKPGSLKEAMNGFTDSQKAMAEFATALSETAKVNISLFASKADSKGNITVQNGSYDPNTHTIYLDINSGAQTAEERSALLKTGSLGDAIGRVAGHEVTHVLENTSVEYYSRYKQAVKAAFKAKGVDYSSLIHEKLKVALENGEKLTYYGAEAEVIADASEYMLQDSKFVKNLETGLKGKIKGIVQTLLDKVNEAFKRLGLSGHFESRILRTMQDGVAHYEKNLQSLWDLAFDEMLGAEDDILREKGVEPTKWQGPNGEQMEVGGKEKVQYAIRDGLITTASTEQERYNVLKDVVLKLAHVNTGGIEDVELDTYNTRKKSAVEKGIKVLANKLGITNVDLANSFIDFPFQFTNKNLGKSLHHQLDYGGTYQDYVKAMSCFEELVESAVPIETHLDKKVGTVKGNIDLKQVYVLVGAFRDSNRIIPVQFEIKEYRGNNGKLYMLVALTKITPEVVEAPGVRNAKVPAPLFSGDTISLRYLIENVNSNDYKFFKYIPDGFLNEEQKAAKARALAEQKNEYDSYENIQKSAREQTVPVSELPTTRQFSMRTSVEKREDGLMAIHNLNARKLLDTLRLGGFPMPSIAIVKAKQGHTMYGDYSVIFGADTIDPKGNADNRVYGNDAWTPVFPPVETELDSDRVFDLRRDTKTLVDDVDGYLGQMVSRFYNNFVGESVTNETEDSTLEKAWRNEGMLAAYLLGNGSAVQVLKHEVPVDRGYKPEYAEIYDAILGVIGDADTTGMSVGKLLEVYGEQLAAANGALNRMWQRYNAGDRRSGIAIINRIGQAKRYNEAGRDLNPVMKTENDYVATAEAMRNQINQDSFDRWMLSKLNRIFKRKGIYNGKERFTSSGGRKSWKATHYDYTVDNVVRAMLQQEESDIPATNASGLKAAASTMYKNLDEIRADSYRLGKVSEEEYNARMAKADNDFRDFLNAIQAWDFDVQEEAGNLLVRASKKRYKAQEIVDLFKSNGFKRITLNAAKIAESVIRQVQTIPTGYFESKPTRVVSFDEVRMVVAPDNIPAELVQALEARSIPYTTYDGTDEDRLEKTNAVENVKFSRRDEALDGVNIREFLGRMTATSRMTETEKLLLKRYKETLSTLEEKEKQVSEQESIMKVATGDELIKARNRRNIYRTQANRAARTLAEAERSDGFARLMATSIDAVNRFTAGTTDNVADATVALEQEISTLTAQLRQIEGDLTRTASGQKAAFARGLFDQKQLNTVAQGLKDTYGSRMSTKAIADRLALAYSEIYADDSADGTHRFAEAVNALAVDILRGNKFRYKSEILTTLSEQIGVIGLTETDLQEIRNAGLTVREYKAMLAPYIKVADSGSDLSSYVSNADYYGDGSLFSIFADGNEGDYAMRLYETISAEKAKEAGNGFEGRSEIELTMEIMASIAGSTLPLTDNSKVAAQLRNEMLKYAAETESAVRLVDDAIEKALATGKATSRVWHAAVKDVNTTKAAAEYYRKLEEQRRITELREQKEMLTDQLKSEAGKMLQEAHERYQQQISDIRLRRDVNIEIGKRTRHIKRIVKKLNDRIIHEEDYKNVKEPLKPAVHALVQTFIDGFGNMVFNSDTASHLRTVYDKIANDDGAPEFYSDDVADWLSDLADMKELDALIRAEGSSSLSAAEEKLVVYSRVAEIADHIYKMVTDADEIFVNGKRESFAAISAEVGNALHAVKDKPLLAGKARKATETLDDLLVRGNLTPQYFFESLKNSGLTSLFNGLLDGQTRYAQAIREGRDAVKEAKRTYKYDSWRNLKIPVEFKTEQGHVIALTTEQMMWVYATAKREATNKLMDTHHLDQGGFRYEADDLPRLKGKMEAIPGSDRLHKLSAADVKKITDTLTAEQKACADELVSYLSNECAELGNEASLELFGIKKYNEEYYFPFKTASDQRYQRSDAGSTSTTNDARVKHASFTHSIRKGANTPLVMGNFFDVISDHINLMATYSSFVVPIESMNRVLNAKMNEDADDSGSEVTIRSMIGRKHGDAAQKYIADLIKDLNGGPQTDNRGGMSGLFRAFKRGAVMGSLSVALQQPTAIVRAFSYVNPKYFAHITMEGNKKTWERMMKYSGTAVIKDMGKFDVGTGKMANDWIANSDVQDYKLLKRMKFLMDNKGFIAAKNNFVETLTALPGFMDRVTWTHIWKAVEAEQAELNPGTDRNSEEFLRTVGARFDDVINHTQVYDSVLAKSQNMRSKNPLTQMSTAFMSEPTLNANMYFSALTGQYTPGERTGMIASVIASNILAAAFAAMISAWNKDDDKRKFSEKYLGEFASRAVDNINPLTMIPYVADLWNMFSGYDIERTDLSVVKDLLDYGTTFFGKLKDGDDITWRDVENFGGTIANLTGIPAKNISRDIRRIRNLIFTDKSASSPAAIKYTLLENAAPLGLWSDSNKAYCQRLVSAVLDGDTQEAYDLWDYLTNSKKASTDSLNSNIRTDLKERVKSGEITPAQATSILRKYASYKNDKDNIGKPLEWLKETE